MGNDTRNSLKTVQNPIKHISYINTKITNKKEILDLLSETFSENSSSKKTLQSIPTRQKESRNENKNPL